MQRLLFVLMVFCLLPLELWAQGTYVPPPDAKMVRVNGKEYYAGEVYLPDHADTVSLTGLGFRNLEFEGRSVGTVKYRALWPVEAALAEMPRAISGLDYERVRGEFPSSDFSSPISADNPTSFQSYPITRLSGPQSGPGWQRTTQCDEIWLLSEQYRKLLDDYQARRMPSCSKTPASVRKDPQLTGAFRVSPVESGPFHKPGNVGTRDPHTTGNFMLTPIETSRKSSLQVRDWSNDNPYTGTMNWGVSDYQPRDEWRGVGFHPLPVCYPPQYRLSIQVPRRRP